MNGSLVATGLTKTFGRLVALDDVSLEVRPGEIVGLMGPNGAGKTTCFNCLTGFTEPTEGRVHLDGRDITAAPAAERARLGMIRTFQQVRLFGHLSVRENLLLGRHLHFGSSPLAAAFGTRRARAAQRAAEEYVDDLAERVGLTTVLGAAVGELPYGTQRMVEIARALAAQPSVLLLDEPGAGMDPVESAYFGDLLLRLHDGSRSILLIEHDVPMVLRVSDRVYVLEFGQLIAEGSPAEIRHNERVRQAYFGTAVEAVQ